MGQDRSGNALNAAMASVLDRIRAEQDLSYAEIVRRSGLPRRTIGRIFHDERRMDVDQLVDTCKALGVSVSDVVNEAVELVEKHS